MEAKTSFAWKISHLSKWGLGMHKSEPFLAGACEWIVVAYVREDSMDKDDWVISLFLRCCSDVGARLDVDGLPLPHIYAKYVLTAATKGNRYLDLLGEGKRGFTAGGKGWGFKHCIKLSSYSHSDEFVADDDAIVINAHIFTGSAIPDSGYDTSYDHQEEDYSSDDTYQEEEDSEYDYQEEEEEEEEEEDSSSSSDADTDQEEDTVDDDASADEPDHTEPDHPPNGPLNLIQESTNHECLSGQKLAAAWEAQGEFRTNQFSSDHQVGCLYPDDPLSSRARLISSDLIAELSTMIISNTKSLASGNASTLLLQQQRETMARYLTMPLEAIHKTDSFQDVEQIANLIADHPSTDVDKAVLQGLLSELKEGVPNTISIIKSCHATDTFMAWLAEDLEARMLHRYRQLGHLKVEVSRLAQEEKTLESEIQQLVARKARVGDQKKSTADELEKVNQEATKEMEEMKEMSSKRKRACEDRLAGEEKLGRLQTSWKALKQTLGL